MSCLALKIITFYLFIVSPYVCSGGIHAIIVCAVVYMLLCVCVCVRGGIHAIISRREVRVQSYRKLVVFFF